MLEKLCFKSCAYVSIVVVVVVAVVAVATIVAAVVHIVVVAVVASHPLCLSNLIYFNVSPSSAFHSLLPLSLSHTDALHISVCAYKRRVLRVRGAWTTTTTAATTITTCNCEMFIKM